MLGHTIESLKVTQACAVPASHCYRARNGQQVVRDCARNHSSNSGEKTHEPSYRSTRQSRYGKKGYPANGRGMCTAFTGVRILACQYYVRKQPQSSATSPTRAQLVRHSTPSGVCRAKGAVCRTSHRSEQWAVVCTLLLNIRACPHHLRQVQTMSQQVWRHGEVYTIL